MATGVDVMIPDEDEEMQKLPRGWFDSFRIYLSRDIMYVLGGGLVLFGFVRVLGLEIDISLPTPVWLFLAVLCYVIGFVTQEAVAFTTHLVQSAPVTRISRRLWWACRRYGIRNPDWEILRYPKREPRLQVYRECENRFLESGEENLLAEFQRTNSLLHVGTAVGANGLLAALLLFGAWWRHGFQVDLHLWLFAGVLALALVCIPLGWVKGIQCTHFIVDFCRRAPAKGSEKGESD